MFSVLDHSLSVYHWTCSIFWLSWCIYCLCSYRCEKRMSPTLDGLASGNREKKSLWFCFDGVRGQGTGKISLLVMREGWFACARLKGFDVILPLSLQSGTVGGGCSWSALNQPFGTGGRVPLPPVQSGLPHNECPSLEMKGSIDRVRKYQQIGDRQNQVFFRSLPHLLLNPGTNDSKYWNIWPTLKES